MSDEQSFRAIMEAKRDSVKHKERRPFRLDERMRLRLDAVQKRIYALHLTLDEWEIRQAYHRSIGEYEYIDKDWRTFRLGDSWGGQDVSAFFRRCVDIPAEFAGEQVVLRIYVGGDSLLSLNGVPYQTVGPFHTDVRLCDCAVGDESYDVEIESYVTWHGKGEPLVHTVRLAELATIDREIHKAYWDLEAIFRALSIANIDTSLQSFLQKHLWNALKQVPVYEDDPNSFKRGVLKAQETVRNEVYSSDRFRGEGLIHLVGHSHLDVVFRWPYREFVRKVGRTHTTMVRLMEEYPEFKFSQSQAKIYADMKRHYPDLYAQVKQRASDRRWEPIGAFWVEPDCNLISGESFVRHILYGQQFWEREFGMRSRTCWQPDVFGMSWAIPQILKRSGIEYVFSNKFFIWNDTNPWRKNTFWWEGLDGSRVLTVVPPGHFIGMVDADHLHDHWRDFSDKGTVGESIYCYGWGDGGAGVNREMLECARRYRDFPGLVRTRYSTAEEALDSIKVSAERAEIPVWHDELYLEAHRGTYTTKGKLKKLNRRCEFLYREAELAAALAWARGSTYPTERLRDGWLGLLTAQFHDSLPGTHVNQVYRDLLSEYDGIESTGHQVRDDALRSLVSCQTTHNAAGGRKERTLFAFNSLLHARKDFASIPAAQVEGCTIVGTEGWLPQQRVSDLDGTERVIVQVPEIPGVGYRLLKVVPKLPSQEVQPSIRVTADSEDSKHSLENEWIRAVFTSNGELYSLKDKVREREIIPSGQVGNKFQLFEDAPGAYDAWDIIAGYREHEIELSDAGSLQVDEEGPLRASLVLQKPCRRSSITQRITLYAGSPMLVFETKVDWVERQKLLKVAFPVDVNCHRATYDIAFGNMERPNHPNTPHDAARFEVPAHQWMDLSEGDYGVSLLNDCKYGHEADGNMMRLSLLKGSISPDPASDIGEHYFIYCLYPHQGRWREAGTIQRALNLNNPLYVCAVDEPEGSDTHSFIHCDAANLTLEAIKRSEDGKHLVIRLVERHNCRTEATLTFDRPVRGAWLCDLMEKIEAKLTPRDGEVTFPVVPYGIVTLRADIQTHIS